METNQTEPKKLGRYHLHEEIGRGGMAVVYRGWDPTLQREVAIKVLHAHLLTHQEVRTRFEREAHAVAGLHDPHVVEVYDYAQSDDGTLFIVMKLVEGITLRAYIDKRAGEPLLAESAALIARKIFKALDAAHRQGIVHRDVKPENILVDNEGQILLSDFGIAFLTDIGQMTTTGQILGSPTYMSPEQIETAKVDARADIFSAGILLYEMVVGHPPFVGSNPHQIIKRVVEGYYDHPLSSRPQIGGPLAAIIVKCLQSNKNDRYETAKLVMTDLEALLNQMGITNHDETGCICVKDPDGFAAKHLPQIIDATLEAAKNARRDGRLPETMNHLNRVLALVPDNETALDMVNVLSRRRKLRRTVEKVAVLVGILLLLAGVVAGIWLLGVGSARNDVPKPSVPLSTPPPDVASDTEPGSVTEPGRNIIIVKRTPADTETAAKPVKRAIKTNRRIRPSGPSKTEETTRQILFNPHPMNVTIVIDNSDRFVYKTTDRSRILPIGPHTITFIPVDDRLTPLTRVIQVTAGEGPQKMSARLKWKPAKVLVNADVNAVVAALGREVGRTNVPFELPINNGPTSKVRLLITAPGYLPIEKTIDIEAGTQTKTTIGLEKETP